jgi:hypothetical protein
LTGSIIDADATLFEVGRRLKYLSQARRRNCQKGKKNEHPITAKGMEGKRATARRERGQQGKAHRQNEKIVLYNTEHTHTHTHFFSEYRLFWISLARSPDFISIRVYLHIQGYTLHTHRRTHVLNLCLSLIFICM